MDTLDLEGGMLSTNMVLEGLFHNKSKLAELASKPCAKWNSGPKCILPRSKGVTGRKCSTLAKEGYGVSRDYGEARKRFPAGVHLLPSWQKNRRNKKRSGESRNRETWARF